jgi:hypothetical protein
MVFNGSIAEPNKFDGGAGCRKMYGQEHDAALF